jgi:hypothetical protein
MEEAYGKLAIVERGKIHVHFYIAFSPAVPGAEMSLIFQRQRRPAACHTAFGFRISDRGGYSNLYSCNKIPHT